jgi:hypothetical protein
MALAGGHGVTSKLLPWSPVVDAFFKVFDAPLPALAIPGFVGGALFSAVLGIAGRRRRFDELSLPRFAAWGALGGLLLSLVPAALVAVGLASLGGKAILGLWQFTAVISAPLMLLSAASAAGSLMLARRAEDRRVLAPVRICRRGTCRERGSRLLGGKDDLSADIIHPCSGLSAARSGPVSKRSANRPVPEALPAERSDSPAVLRPERCGLLVQQGTNRSSPDREGPRPRSSGIAPATSTMVTATIASAIRKMGPVMARQPSLLVATPKQ